MNGPAPSGMIRKTRNAWGMAAMGVHGARWKAISQSEYGWEREALEFIRKRPPDREPHRAGANF